jgi:hypothetical protein
VRPLPTVPVTVASSRAEPSLKTLSVASVTCALHDAGGAEPASQPEQVAPVHPCADRSQIPMKPAEIVVMPVVAHLPVSSFPAYSTATRPAQAETVPKSASEMWKSVSAGT